MPDQPPVGANLPNPPIIGAGPSVSNQNLPGFGPIYTFLVNQFLQQMTLEQLEDETRVAQILSSCQRTANKILSNFKSLGIAYQIPQSPNPWSK